jgi:hypothetical protein
MATTRIAELIDKVDSFETLRDEIAAILAVESARQQALAQAAGKNPLLWALRVYTERSAPWAAFPDVAETGSPSGETTPVVNVCWDAANYERSGSNVFENQKTVGTFNIDCYGYGVAIDEGTSQTVADQAAALEAQRAFRLVRNILMAAHWHKLGQPSFVWERWPASAQAFQPQRDNVQTPNVQAIRFALEVTFNEFSPQYVPEELELVSTQVKRDGDGMILVTVDIETPPLTP